MKLSANNAHLRAPSPPINDLDLANKNVSPSNPSPLPIIAIGELNPRMVAGGELSGRIVGDNCRRIAHELFAANGRIMGGGAAAAAR